MGESHQGIVMYYCFGEGKFDRFKAGAEVIRRYTEELYYTRIKEKIPTFKRADRKCKTLPTTDSREEENNEDDEIDPFDECLFPYEEEEESQDEEDEESNRVDIKTCISSGKMITS